MHQLTFSTVASSSSTPAEPERKPKAEVVFLPAPSDKHLVHELRQMVAGESVLNESKKA